MELNKFLIRAKISGYASGKDGKLLEDGAKEIVYEEGEFRYVDKYYGFNPFVGEEIVFKNDRAIWSMDYHGKIISDMVQPEKVYEFLRKALGNVREDKPFRGPDNFEEGDFKYTNDFIGDMNDFSGTERIFFKTHEVYILRYHGGRQ